jgi:hypothetical protein
MGAWIRTHLAYANVMATVAAAIAIGGGTWALGGRARLRRADGTHTRWRVGKSATDLVLTGDVTVAFEAA